MRTLARSAPLSPSKKRALRELHQFILFKPDTGYKFPRPIVNGSIKEFVKHLGRKGRFRVEYQSMERGIITPEIEPTPINIDYPSPYANVREVSEVIAHPCTLTHHGYNGMSLDLSFEMESGEVTGETVFTGVRFMPEKNLNRPNSAAYDEMIRAAKRCFDTYFFQ